MFFFCIRQPAYACDNTDIHFAIGNFIKNGLNNEPILVKGDGTSYRSYLYAADLAVWLWTILLRGRILQPYNVGSDEMFTIKEIANLVAQCFHPSLEVKINKTASHSSLPDRYVPDISLARRDLTLTPKVHILTALQSTINWYLTKQW